MAEIDELARPVLGRPFGTVNRLAGPLSRRYVHLDAADLVVKAMSSTGLSDLDGERWSEPLEVLCRALDREADLHALGRVAARAQLTGMLATRARLARLVGQRPEILDQSIDAPIVILGMPRTGTTFLQRLIAQDPTIRSLPYWEALAPLPTKYPADRSSPIDDRIEVAERGVKLVDRAAPLMKSIHELDPLAADEEIWLLGLEMTSMLFEASWHVPAYAEWYDSADLTDAYRYLRRVLQALQWYRSAERWVLKSPQHLEQLGPLVGAFPDAVVVQTHRDPVSVVTSCASMISYSRRMGTSNVNPTQIGRYWAWRVETLLHRSMSHRPAVAASHPGARFIDVHFAALMADPLGAVADIYALAGRPFTDEARAAMSSWLAANPRAKHGAHRYQPTDFGLDAADIRRRFADYTAHFGVEPES